MLGAVPFKLLVFLKIQDPDRLIKLIAKFGNKKMPKIVCYIGNLEPSFRDQFVRCKIGSDDGVARRGIASKTRRNRYAM